MVLGTAHALSSIYSLYLKREENNVKYINYSKGTSETTRELTFDFSSYKKKLCKHKPLINQEFLEFNQKRLNQDDHWIFGIEWDHMLPSRNMDDSHPNFMSYIPSYDGVPLNLGLSYSKYNPFEIALVLNNEEFPNNINSITPSTSSPILQLPDVAKNIFINRTFKKNVNYSPFWSKNRGYHTATNNRMDENNNETLNALFPCKVKEIIDINSNIKDVALNLYFENISDLIKSNCDMKIIQEKYETN